MDKMRVVPWLLVFVTPAFLTAAQGEPDTKRQAPGARLFRTNCAPCHGVDARGEGPVASQLRFAPADLTGIARRNGGKFSADRVRRIIDGRHSVKGHGATDMPVWGDAFKTSEEGFSDKKAQEKITLVVEYLASIQRRAER